MIEKVGQRKFLLKEGYTEEQLDKMSPSQAHSIISKIEKGRESKYIHPRTCLVCGSLFSISHTEYCEQPVSICHRCKEAIMKVREEFNLF